MHIIVIRLEFRFTSRDCECDAFAFTVAVSPDSSSLRHSVFFRRVFTFAMRRRRRSLAEAARRTRGGGEEEEERGDDRRPGSGGRLLPDDARRHVHGADADRAGPVRHVRVATEHHSHRLPHNGCAPTSRANSSAISSHTYF